MAEYKYDIFISHAHIDADTVDPIIKELEKRGLAIWNDRLLSGNEELSRVIEDTLNQARNYLILVTPASLVSEWVNFEIGYAISRATSSPEVRIIPVLSRGVKWKDLPSLLSNWRGIDASTLTPMETVDRICEMLEEE